MFKFNVMFWDIDAFSNPLWYANLGENLYPNLFKAGPLW